MNQNMQTHRPGDVLIDSNWIMSVGMALLFAFTAFLLVWSIRDVLFFKFEHGFPQHVRSGWTATLTYAIGVAYFALFAYSFRARLLKLAFLLLVAKYVGLLALTHLSFSTKLQHSLVFAVAIAGQIAYVIILVAIARWFKSVMRRVPPTDSGVSGS